MENKTKSLYRKHRPKKFTDVIGQEFVVKTLVNQIKNDAVAHAYLFCGTRGCGKTSVAKIFARAVNDNKDNIELDVFELDAASNNGVDDVRDLIEKVKYPPVNAKYKVYIIDEVHMFSTSAFNALLKTLEEPPSYVIFILATTEPHKLPPTILSRCLRFDFRNASNRQIEELLESVFKKEKIEADKQVIQMIAREGKGSFRDALSIAETIASYGNKVITVENVTQALGSVDNKTLQKLIDHIQNKNLQAISDIVKEIFAVGRNINSVIKDCLEIIKQKYVESKDAKLMQMYKNFAELEINIKTATDAKAMFEGTCLVCTIA